MSVRDTASEELGARGIALEGFAQIEALCDAVTGDETRQQLATIIGEMGGIALARQHALMLGTPGYLVRFSPDDSDPRP